MSDAIPEKLLAGDPLRTALLKDDPNNGALIPGTSVDELMERVSHDKLMKIASRDELENTLNEIEEQDIVASLIMMDLDHFKKVNDTYGHNTGDELLAKMGERLKRHVKSTDLVGRWGGEEFILICKGLNDALVLQDRAEEIRCEVGNEPFQLGDVKLHITISVGATVRKEGETTEKWIKRADEAMYKAKNAGRNQVVVAE